MKASIVDAKLRVWVDPLRLFVHVAIGDVGGDGYANPFFSPALQVMALCILLF